MSPALEYDRRGTYVKRKFLPKRSYCVLETIIVTVISLVVLSTEPERKPYQTFHHREVLRPGW